MKNPWDVVSGFKHDNRLKCHRGIVSQWTFQVGLNVTVDETWVDVTSRHHIRFTMIAGLQGLKRLSHEIFRPVFWPVWMHLGLNENRLWF
jgi:hypothetical protein